MARLTVLLVLVLAALAAADVEVEHNRKLLQNARIGVAQMSQQDTAKATKTTVQSTQSFAALMSNIQAAAGIGSVGTVVLDRPAGPSTVADDIATRAATGTRPASRHLLQRNAGPRNDVAQKLTQDEIRRCVQAANSNRGTPGCTKRATSAGQAAVQIVARPGSVPLTTANAKVANSGRHLL